MQYTKLTTIYLNMEPDGADAIPGKSESLYFCNSTIHPVLPLVSKLSNLFSKLYLNNTPQDVSIFIPTSAIAKYKKEDQETSYDRLIYLINSFKPPVSPIRITVYIKDIKINQTWDYHHLWEMKTLHCFNNNKIMTFHYPENLMKCILDPAVEDCFKVAKNFAKENGYKIKEIDYTMKYSDVIQLLLETTVHISYVGASYYLAGLTRTPTIGFGHKNPFGKNVWNSFLIGSNNMLQLKNGILCNGEINYSVDTIDPNETLFLLERYK